MIKTPQPRENAEFIAICSDKFSNFGALNLFYLKISRFL